MGKMRVTTKELKKFAEYNFQASYCQLTGIFSDSDYDFYTTGQYGWNFDAVYDKELSVLITTGYRNMFGMRIPQKLIDRYARQLENLRRKPPLGMTTKMILSTVSIIQKNFMRDLKDLYLKGDEHAND